MHPAYSVAAPHAPTDTGASRSLTVSVVVFRPDLDRLGETFEALAHAIVHARHEGEIDDVHVDVVDNEPGASSGVAVEVAERALSSLPDVHVRLLAGHGNVGYGLGHNRSILAADTAYHLVLNPDLVMAPDALAEAARFLREHGDVGLVTPRVVDEHGALQYLARRRPTVSTLFLRGFAPGAVRRRFADHLARYEMRDRIGDGGEVVHGVPCATGCFMFARGELLRRVGGFSDAYFMYFEDYELSLALGARADVVFVPSVQVMHYGGNAARKGVHHVRLFVRSAFTFFRRNGWKLV